MKKKFIKERAEEIAKVRFENGSYSDEMIEKLPKPMQRYLKVCGYTNSPIINNAEILWKEASIKMDRNKKWTKLKVKQYNSVMPISRITYMKFANMPIAGRDIFHDSEGEMKGKLLNLVTVIKGTGKEISQSILIAAFCEFMLVPGYIFQDYVRWEELDEKSVKGILDYAGFKVSGIFHFNDRGLFTHVGTDDRYFSAGKDKYLNIKYSAYIDSYQQMGQYIIPEKIKAVWHFADGDYEYYKGCIERMEFNVTQ